jgi:hypothetical protein
MTKVQTDEKQQIRLDVKYRIQRGEPKQLILEDLAPLYKDKATLVRTIESTPSKAMKAKYGIYNWILAALLLAAFVLDIILVIKESENLTKWEMLNGQFVINFNTIISVVLDAVFLIGVLRIRTDIYSWISTRALITLIAILVTVTYHDAGISGIHILLWIAFGLILISFFLGMFLGVKMCPRRVPKEIEVEVPKLSEEEGFDKIRKTIYVYPD